MESGQREPAVVANGIDIVSSDNDIHRVSVTVSFDVPLKYIPSLGTVTSSGPVLTLFPRPLEPRVPSESDGYENFPGSAEYITVTQASCWAGQRESSLHLAIQEKKFMTIERPRRIHVLSFCKWIKHKPVKYAPLQWDLPEGAMIRWPLLWHYTRWSDMLLERIATCEGYIHDADAIHRTYPNGLVKEWMEKYGFGHVAADRLAQEE